MSGVVLLSTSKSTAGLVTLKSQANKHPPLPVHSTQAYPLPSPTPPPAKNQALHYISDFELSE